MLKNRPRFTRESRPLTLYLPNNSKETEADSKLKFKCCKFKVTFMQKIFLYDSVDSRSEVTFCAVWP